MKTLAVGRNNDITAENGQLKIATDKEAIGAVCLSNIRTNKGELLLNTSAGIPYFDVLFGCTPNLDKFKIGLQESIMKVDGVDSINSIEFSTDNDVLKYEISINTKYGEVTING